MNQRQNRTTERRPNPETENQNYRDGKESRTLRLRFPDSGDNFANYFYVPDWLSPAVQINGRSRSVKNNDKKARGGIRAQKQNIN